MNFLTVGFLIDFFWMVLCCPEGKDQLESLDLILPQLVSYVSCQDRAITAKKNHASVCSDNVVKSKSMIQHDSIKQHLMNIQKINQLQVPKSVISAHILLMEEITT